MSMGLKLETKVLVMRMSIEPIGICMKVDWEGKECHIYIKPLKIAVFN